MGVARRGPVPSVPEQLADQGQVFARHDGLAGCGVAKVVQAQPAEPRVFADRPPARSQVRRAIACGSPLEGRAGATSEMRPRALELD